MNDLEPVSNRRYVVQFTETAGGPWQEDKDFETEAAALESMRHLVDGLGKASARVLHEVAYHPHQVSN